MMFCFPFLALYFLSLFQENFSQFQFVLAQIYSVERSWYYLFDFLYRLLTVKNQSFYLGDTLLGSDHSIFFKTLLYFAVYSQC